MLDPQRKLSSVSTVSSELTSLSSSCDKMTSLENCSDDDLEEYPLDTKNKHNESEQERKLSTTSLVSTVSEGMDVQPPNVII